MDFRSFDVNLEVNAIVSDEGIANGLQDIFFNDLKEAGKIDADLWYKRSRMNQMWKRQQG